VHVGMENVVVAVYEYLLLRESVIDADVVGEVTNVLIDARVKEESRGSGVEVEEEAA
jgi:hypothetical protein